MLARVSIVNGKRVIILKVNELKMARRGQAIAPSEVHLDRFVRSLPLPFRYEWLLIGLRREWGYRLQHLIKSGFLFVF
jgi:hypothetical protein